MFAQMVLPRAWDTEHWGQFVKKLNLYPVNQKKSEEFI